MANHEIEGSYRPDQSAENSADNIDLRTKVYITGRRIVRKINGERRGPKRTEVEFIMGIGRVCFTEDATVRKDGHHYFYDGVGVVLNPGEKVDKNGNITK